jgi:DNA-directed RNA polymerase subunit beta
MPTNKSEQAVGRAKAFEAIVKGTDIPTPKVPESFKVLIKELNALGLNVVPIGATVSDKPLDAPIESETEIKAAELEEKTEKEAQELQQELGGGEGIQPGDIPEGVEMPESSVEEGEKADE